MHVIRSDVPVPREGFLILSEPLCRRRDWRWLLGSAILLTRWAHMVLLYCLLPFW